MNSMREVAGIVVVMIMIIFRRVTISVLADPGTASFYDPPYVPSACFGKEDHGKMVVAASKSIWRNSMGCGFSCKVHCTGSTNLAPNPCKKGSVLVQIVDHCPNCDATINLSRDAFDMIADLSAGVVNVNYTIGTS